MANEKIRRTKWAIAYECLLVILAIISVISMFSTITFIHHLDRYIWGLFFIDVCTRFIIAKNKWQFVKRNPFDIIAALPFDAIFQTARIVRLFRLLRFVAIAKNYFPHFFKLLRTNHLDRILLTAGLLIVVGGTVVTFTEPDIGSFADGIWWSVVTTTTVGYGDISPDTISGRLVAIVLMLVGIGIIGALTSAITTFFIKEEEDEDESASDPAIAFIQQQIHQLNHLTTEEIDQLLALLKEYRKHAPSQEEKSD